jgi:hypothetical protein
LAKPHQEFQGVAVNARRILTGLDIAPLLAQLSLYKEWNTRGHVFDPSWISPHMGYWPENIVLRQTHSGQVLRHPITGQLGAQELPFIHWDRPARKILSAVNPILAALKAAVDCDVLGKVGITRMRPGDVIEPHVDVVSRPVRFERYQVPLIAEEGVHYIVSGEVVPMVPGEAWWFDKAALHSVDNFSTADRLAMVVEMRPNEF